MNSSPHCPLFVINVWVLFHHEVIVRRIAQRTRTYKHTELSSRDLSMTCLTIGSGNVLCVVCGVLCVVCCVLCGVLLSDRHNLYLTPGLRTISSPILGTFECPLFGF